MMARQLAPTDCEPEKEMKIQSPTLGVQPKREESPHAISGKKKVTRKRYDIPKTVPCHICGEFYEMKHGTSSQLLTNNSHNFYFPGDLAAEHLHYGGTACYRCRAFFRYLFVSWFFLLSCQPKIKFPARLGRLCFI